MHQQLLRTNSSAGPALSPGLSSHTSFPQIQASLIINDFLTALGYRMDSSGALEEPSPVFSPGQQLGDEGSVLALGGTLIPAGRSHIFLKTATSCSSRERFSAMENQRMFKKDTKFWGFPSAPVVPPGLTQMPNPGTATPEGVANPEETPRVICCPQEGSECPRDRPSSPGPAQPHQSCCCCCKLKASVFLSPGQF